MGWPQRTVGNIRLSKDSRACMPTYNINRYTIQPIPDLFLHNSRIIVNTVQAILAPNLAARRNSFSAVAPLLPWGGGPSAPPPPSCLKVQRSEDASVILSVTCLAVPSSGRPVLMSSAVWYNNGGSGAWSL